MAASEDGAPTGADAVSGGSVAPLGDAPASPTWPIEVPGSNPSPPPVGLNWGDVARRYSADVRVLMHDGYIVLRGEFIPETGYFIDPDTLRASRVDVGQRVLRHGYLVGRLTASEFHVQLDLIPDSDGTDLDGAIVRVVRGPVIGVFSDRRDAERCRDSILSGSIGSGVSLQDGPLGTEIHVRTAEIAGRVATSIASFGGAVISVGGVPIATGRGEVAALGA
jgi:hypothetical protein